MSWKLINTVLLSDYCKFSLDFELVISSKVILISFPEGIEELEIFRMERFGQFFFMLLCDARFIL